jgi:hypothetical protein
MKKRAIEKLRRRANVVSKVTMPGGERLFNVGINVGIAPLVNHGTALSD